VGHGAARRCSLRRSARSRQPRPPPAPQLDAAGEVLRRRRVGLRRQPRRLRGAFERRQPPLHPGGDRILRRRRHEQLSLEPAVDVQAEPRALRLSGLALLRRGPDRLRRESRHPDRARRSRRRQDRLAGDCDRARDAGELRRQQALVVSETTLRRALGVAAAVAGLAFVSPAFAAPPLTQAKQRLTEARAVAIFEADDKVADWLARYPPKRLSTSATYEPESSKCDFGA